MSRQLSSRTDIHSMDRYAKDNDVQRAADQKIMDEARKLRSYEMEKKRQEDEGGSDSGSRYDQVHKSQSKYSSRNSSVEPGSINSSSSRVMDTREIRHQIRELEEKLKVSMVANAQLDSEKQLLRYEVDLIQDKLEDLIDVNQCLSKAASERKREIAYQRMQITEHKHRLDYARVQVEMRDQLMAEHGLVLFGGTDADAAVVPPVNMASGEAALVSMDQSDGHRSHIQSSHTTHSPSSKLRNGYANPNDEGHDGGDIPLSPPRVPGMALVSSEIATLLKTVPGDDVESRLSYIFNERKEFQKKIDQLETSLEEQKQRADIAQKYDTRSKYNGPDSEEQKQVQLAKSQAQDFKFKYQQAQQKVTSLEGDIIRLEGQVRRYKAIADTCETQEEELKQDRRRLQRDVREKQSLIEDYKSEISTLRKKVEKLSKNSILSGASSSLRSYRESSQAR